MPHLPSSSIILHLVFFGTPHLKCLGKGRSISTNWLHGLNLIEIRLNWNPYSSCLATFHFHLSFWICLTFLFFCLFLFFWLWHFLWLDGRQRFKQWWWSYKSARRHHFWVCILGDRSRKFAETLSISFSFHFHFGRIGEGTHLSNKGQLASAVSFRHESQTRLNWIILSVPHDQNSSAEWNLAHRR